MYTRDQAPGPTIQRVVQATPPELQSRHQQFMLLRHKAVGLQKPLSKSLHALSVLHQFQRRGEITQLRIHD